MTVPSKFKWTLSGRNRFTLAISPRLCHQNLTPSSLENSIKKSGWLHLLFCGICQCISSSSVISYLFYIVPGIQTAYTLSYFVSIHFLLKPSVSMSLRYKYKYGTSVYVTFIYKQIHFQKINMTWKCDQNILNELPLCNFLKHIIYIEK